MSNFTAFSCSLQGYSHFFKNQPCEDAAGKYESDRVAIIAVADGIGDSSVFRASNGSQFAVETAIEVLKKHFDNETEENQTVMPQREDEQDEFLKRIEKEILNTWLDKISSHFQETPFSELEKEVLSPSKLARVEQGDIAFAYSTTLIAVIRTASFWLAIHVGDGNCICASMIPDGEGQLFNMTEITPNTKLGYSTNALSDANVLDTFRHHVSFTIPPVIMIHTDGLDDATLSEEHMEIEHLKLLTKLKDTDDSMSFDGIKAEIERYATGAGEKQDDTSLALILDMDQVVDLTGGAEEQYRKKEEAYHLAKYRNTLTDLNNRADGLRKEVQKAQQNVADLKELGLRTADEGNELYRKSVQTRKLSDKYMQEYAEKKDAYNKLKVRYAKEKDIADFYQKHLDVLLKQIADCEKIIQSIVDPDYVDDSSTVNSEYDLLTDEESAALIAAALGDDDDTDSVVNDDAEDNNSADSEMNGDDVDLDVDTVVYQDGDADAVIDSDSEVGDGDPAADLVDLDILTNADDTVTE